MGKDEKAGLIYSENLNGPRSFFREARPAPAVLPAIDGQDAASEMPKPCRPPKSSSHEDPRESSLGRRNRRNLQGDGTRLANPHERSVSSMAEGNEPGQPRHVRQQRAGMLFSKLRGRAHEPLLYGVAFKVILLWK